MADEVQTVYVVDDDPSMRQSLYLLLSSAGYDVKIFVSARQFLESKPNTESLACLVLDVMMPDISGLELQKELISLNDAIPIIFITGHGNIPMSVQAMKLGAVDFLSKPFDDSLLLDAVHEALVKDEQTRTVLDEYRHIRGRIDTLSPRELEVLTYLVAGLLNKQIAHELKIAERTVKAHRKQIFDKMGVKSIAELVRLTEKAGIKPAVSSEY